MREAKVAGSNPSHHETLEKMPDLRVCGYPVGPYGIKKNFAIFLPRFKILENRFVGAAHFSAAPTNRFLGAAWESSLQIVDRGTWVGVAG